MTPQEEVKRILEELWMEGKDTDSIEFKLRDVSYALTAIDLVYKKLVPEEKQLVIRVGKPKNTRYNKEIMGYNACAAEMKRRLG